MPPSATQTVQEASTTAPGLGTLGLWDTVSLIVGIVVGVSIFRVSPVVFSQTGSSFAGLAIWGAGALLAGCGALCYCELASTYPEFGGEYVYLTRAYGRRTGFLFAWMQTCVIMTGSLGAMSFVFADYAGQLHPALTAHSGWLAAAALLAPWAVHLTGLRPGTIAQNVLTVGKIASLAALVISGLTAPAPVAGAVSSATPEVTPSGVGLALVFVLYAYGGWNDAATVTPEVRDCRRKMPAALLIGLSLVAITYLVVNASYLRALGFEGLCAAQAPAAEVMARRWGAGGQRAISIFIMISALGAIHGMLFAGCRLLAAVGRREQLFQRWSVWSRRDVPSWALSTLVSIALLLIAAVGTQRGRDSISRSARTLALPPPDWEHFDGGFNALLAGTAPVFWLFFFLSGLSVILLRVRDPRRPRPFRTPLYPAPPLLFSGAAAFMFWSSWNYAWKLTLWTAPLWLLGGLAVSISRPARAAEAADEGEQKQPG